MPFATQYYVTAPNPKEIMSKCLSIQQKPLLCEVFKKTDNTIQEWAFIQRNTRDSKIIAYSFGAV